MTWEWMWELDSKESWAPKTWCFWTVVLEKTLKSPLHCKEIKPVNPKGNQPWIFTERTDAEAEAPIPWQSDVKSCLIRKDPDAGKDWRQEKKGWMASLTWWTWVWVNYGSWWWRGRPGVLWFMGLQRVGHDWSNLAAAAAAASLLYDPALTSIHDFWKNHSFDYTDICRQSDVAVF